MPSKKDAANGSGGSGKITKEEERLLLESSRQVTGTTSALFYGNAFVVSALPICEFHRLTLHTTNQWLRLCSLSLQGCTGVCR